MLLRHALPLSTLLLVSACRASAPDVADVTAGAALSHAEAPIALERVLAEPEQWNGRTLTLAGTAREVCAKKGCWLTMAAGERELRMTFQDYAFFVPLDAAGSQVLAEGVFKIEETPVEEARHYLEDAGRHAEAAAITAPVKSYTFLASGVELRRP